MSVQEALDTVGGAYLEAEQHVLAQGEAAVPELEAARLEGDQLRRLTAEVLLERVRANPTYEAVLEYFERAEQRAAETILGKPPPLPVANYLVQHFGAAAAPLLASYLVKLGDAWPDWRTLGAVLYLARAPSPAAPPALARFAATTQRDQYRQASLEALVESDGPTALAALEAELGKELSDPVRESLQSAADQLRIA